MSRRLGAIWRGLGSGTRLLPKGRLGSSEIEAQADRRCPVYDLGHGPRARRASQIGVRYVASCHLTGLPSIGHSVRFLLRRCPLASQRHPALAGR